MGRAWLFGSLFIGMMWAGVARAESVSEREIGDLERRVDRLERSVRNTDANVRSSGAAGGVFFLFGVFCALWAQNTGRSAWLWFFLGLFFHVITTLFLLSKNADDKQRRATAE